MMAVAPKDTHQVTGMGRVFDWRGTGLLPPSGGAIPVHGMVHHIPVVPNVPGSGDFLSLANVLRAQGLSLQFATDREGNVALYNPANVLCWQARGGNSVTCGVEHMHMTIAEPWTERQYRAAGWLAWWVHRHHGLPYRHASVKPLGAGAVRFARTGHTTHRKVADVAGFHDRVDPGPNFSRGHVYELARFYEKHRTFKNAPKVH